MSERASFRPGTLWPDDRGVHINAHGGGVLFHDGAYYWFGEHKLAGTAGNAAHVGIHVYESRDLYNWRDAGIALAVADDPASPIARGCILERPKVIYNRATRRFVMWFHLEPTGAGYTGALSGVAVAERPAGPYTFVASFRPNAGVWPVNVGADLRRPLDPAEAAVLAGMDLDGAPRPYFPPDLVFRRDFAGGQMARDMTLFVDDDGTAYHLYASEDSGTLHVSQLSDDYLSCGGRYARAFPGRFHEAPAVLKHGGRYFPVHVRVHRVGPEPRPAVRGRLDLGTVDGADHAADRHRRAAGSGFESQPTFVLPVAGRPGAYIFMADRWRPRDAIDGRHVWLPIEFHHGLPMARWHDEWDLRAFG